EQRDAPAAEPAPKATAPEPAPWPGSIGVPQAGTSERATAPEPAPWPGSIAVPQAATSEPPGAPDWPVAPGRSGAADDTGERASAESGSGETAGTHAGLPRRVRQESIAPQLRGERPAPVSDTAAPSSRSPEDTGALIASMQAGWRRGRAEADTNEPVDGEGSR
ncbi:MAG: hypothetical protein ACRDOO_27515, partial [Actinomadura sp.]